MDNRNKCPSTQILFDYYLNNLKPKDCDSLEEHFFSCKNCISEVRKLSIAFEKIKLMEANSMLGKAFEKIGDYVDVKAAADSDKTRVKEFLTKNKKFRVILRPLEDNPAMSLLEVKVTDPSIDETVSICVLNINKTAAIDDNHSACFLVDSAIDISKLYVVLCPKCD